MRYLALDLGGKRTGVAVGDDRTKIASPLEVIDTSADAERWRRVARLIDEHGPGALVIGLPLNMDDTPGPAAEAARATASQLQQRFGLPVHLVDERLSSAAADERMARTGLTRAGKKARRDALAAAEILQRFLDASAEPPA